VCPAVFQRVGVANAPTFVSIAGIDSHIGGTKQDLEIEKPV
jgi:hypothetical protein